MMSAPELATAALFVISGNQGAGKSTVGELLAKRFPVAAHIDGDHLQHFVVSGGRWPASLDDLDTATGRVVGEAGRQLRVRLHNGCSVASSFVDAGITAVLTDIICGPRFEEMIEHLAGRTIYFVMLRPPVEVLRLRESHRGSGLNDFENHLEAAIDKTPRVGLWLESATMTADATVDEILSRREEAQIELRA